MTDLKRRLLLDPSTEANVRIERWIAPLCALKELGEQEKTVKCTPVAFRPDSLRTNVTAPCQAIIEQITLAGQPVFIHGEAGIDAWTFSTHAEQLMRDAWFKERGTTETEWLAKIEADAKILDEKMRREEAGETVEWGDEDEEEEGPPMLPRLDFPTVIRNQEMTIKVRYLVKVPKTKLMMVTLTGFAKELAP